MTQYLNKALLLTNAFVTSLIISQLSNDNFICCQQLANNPILSNKGIDVLQLLKLIASLKEIGIGKSENKLNWTLGIAQYHDMQT